MLKASSPNLLLHHSLACMSSELVNFLFYAPEDTLRGALGVFSNPISSKLLCPADHWLPTALLKCLQIRRRLPTRRVSNPGMKNGHRTIEKHCLLRFSRNLRIPGWRKKGNCSANRVQFLKGSFEAWELSTTQGRKKTPVNLLPRRLCCRVMQKDREMLEGGGVWTVC